MIDLTSMQKQMLLKVASRFNIIELERFERMYIDKEVSIKEIRVVQMYHDKLKHIIEIAKVIDAEFELSHSEQKILEKKLDSPLEILWEGWYSETKPNEKCLLQKTIPDIHRYINKLLSTYNGLYNYLKPIAFIYNYLVKNGLEEKAININKIKENLLKNKTKIKSLDNKHNHPKENDKYFEQDVPF